MLTLDSGEITDDAHRIPQAQPLDQVQGRALDSPTHTLPDGIAPFLQSKQEWLAQTMSDRAEGYVLARKRRDVDRDEVFSNLGWR